MTDKPQPHCVTDTEGGDWIPWLVWKRIPSSLRSKVVHAIMFEDGSIWDAVNGWRTLAWRSDAGTTCCFSADFDPNKEVPGRWMRV